MGHRLSKIYTRTGDDGTTGLGDGSRTDKDSARVEAMGAVDELNSVIGMLLAEGLAQPVHDYLIDVQHRLFDIGGEMSLPGQSLLVQACVDGLETALDDLNADLPPLKEFILPGGGKAGSLAHVARTICRRAERRVLTLSRAESVNPVSMVYLNRLSDLLFVIARVVARASGKAETLWKSDSGQH